MSFALTGGELIDYRTALKPRRGRELLRLMLQAHLDERGPGAVSEPVVDATGQAHTHQRLHSRSLKTIFGSVTITRQGYGGRSLESLHPLDAKLNLPPERCSEPGHRVTVAIVASRGPGR